MLGLDACLKSVVESPHICRPAADMNEIFPKERSRFGIGVKRAPSPQQSNVAIFGDDNLKIGTNSLLFSITLPHASGDHIFFHITPLKKFHCRLPPNEVSTKISGFLRLRMFWRLWRQKGVDGAADTQDRKFMTKFSEFQRRRCELWRISMSTHLRHNQVSSLIFISKKRFSWNEMTLD